MPIYEYECKNQHRFERFLEVKYFSEVSICLECLCVGELVPSLVSMQPDKFWSGVNTEQGYVTSNTQHKNILKDRGLERIEKGMIDEVKKKAKNRIPETLEKNAKKAEKWLANELKNA